ncbi:MAG: glycosyltransferase [Ruminococcus sp.]|nr:glycosyltransferase [Ruminococcus sp.]
MSAMFSIIVPVYNCEGVIERCINSVINQTFSDFELILIDDGSPDNSGRICDKYAENYDNIIVNHQKNAGVSAARNAGLKIANGKYIVFIDSDDYIDDNYLECFSIDNTVDLMVAGLSIFSPDGAFKEKLSSEYKRIVEAESDMVDFLKEGYAIQVWGKRFSRKIIEDNNIIFNEDFQYGEDSIFVAEYLMNIKSYRTTSKTNYDFCQSDKPSLSKLDMSDWFLSYTVLQEYIYKLFDNFKTVQKHIADKYWWAAENEMVRLSNLDVSLNVKCKLMKTIISNKFFQSIAKEKRDINKIIKFSIKTKIPFPLIYVFNNGGSNAN